MYKVCIDAGHGGKDPGAVNKKRHEKNDNLEMALKVENILQSQGVEVVMTRSKDVDVSLASRTSLANREGCDLFLSIHRDSFGSTANGVTVYVYSLAPPYTVAFGKEVLNETVKAGGFYSRGVRKGAANFGDYATNRDTKMPACLLELGFLSSDVDNKKYDENKDAIAKGIATAICKTLGQEYKEAKPKVEEAAKASAIAPAPTPVSASASAPALKTTTKKTNNEVAREVLQGKWGNGQDRINKLKAAGYDPSAVQKIVNSLISGTSQAKSVNVIAKEVIQGKWGNGSEREYKLKAAGYNYSQVQKEVNRTLGIR